MALPVGQSLHLPRRGDGSIWTPDRTISTGPNAARVAAALGGFTIPFAFTYPADPVITSSATVTPATFAANNVNGREITLTAGNYGNVTVSGSDRDLILQSGAVIDTLTVASGSGVRLRVRAETPRTGQISDLELSEGQGSSHVLLDGLNVTNANRVYGGASPLAIINSTIHADTSFGFSSWNNPHAFMLIANTDIQAPGTGDAVVRIQTPSNLVWVGNRTAGGPSAAYHTFRVHADGAAGGTVENVFVAGCQFEGSRLGIIDRCCGSSAGSGLLIENVWFEDNDFYMTGANSAFISTYDSPGINSVAPIGYFSLQRNNGYGSAGAWLDGSPWTGRGYDIGGNNTISAYQSPPAWSHS